MINSHKITVKIPHQQIAGILPEDNNIEFSGINETQEVLWIQNGRTLPFKYLPKWAYRICQEKYLSDRPALQQLTELNCSLERQVELYIYYMYGDLDEYADIKDGVLQPSENFRPTKNDPSLNWDHKWITIDNVPLNNRDLLIIDMMLEDAKDEAIAKSLNITTSTFNFHKKNLFIKTNVISRTGLVIKALKQHI